MKFICLIIMASISFSCSGTGKEGGNSQTSSSVNFEFTLKKEVNHYNHEVTSSHVVQSKKFVEGEENKERISR